LQQLVELAYEYQPTSTLRTSDFIRLVETRKIADPQAADVRVMTIHQAKGLQFDVVFLPELEAKLIGQPDRFVAGRPGPTEPVNVVCRLANENVRQFFSPALQKLFEDDMCREVSESLCVLYVAMTRAVHALHMIIAPAKANEKSMPKTFAGVLRATLAAGQPAAAGSTLYEHGDPKWFLARTREGEAPVEPRVVGDAAARREPRPSVQLAPSAERRHRGLERTSPSALEGGSRLSGASVLTAKSAAAFGIGTLFHAWLEQIEWLDDGEPSDDTLRQVAASLWGKIGDLSPQLDALIARFRQQLASGPIAAVLSRSFYKSPENLGLQKIKTSGWPTGPIELTAQRERSFAIRDSDKILSGSIDRLVIIKSRGKVVAADVLDFKTDELPAGDKATLAAKLAFYRPQLDAYRAAASQILGLQPAWVGGRLVFVGSGSVFDTLLMR
jgi:ATP-dependent exoDNAse (exonuclease V) beta subunit